MFRVKICGVTNLADARAAAEAGADAIGLNFYSKSARFVQNETAQDIVVSVPAGVVKVGVFVNHDVDAIKQVIEQLDLDYVQLHGDEPPALLAELPKAVRIIRAFRYGRDGLSKVSRYLTECRALGRVPDAVLLDSDWRAEFGGTGRVADWNAIAGGRDALNELPLILAGGLTPDNVAEGIRIVRPNGVDVASGVESSPGIKDHAKMRSFVAAARAALS